MEDSLPLIDSTLDLARFITSGDKQYPSSLLSVREPHRSWDCGVAEVQRMRAYFVDKGYEVAADSLSVPELGAGQVSLLPRSTVLTVAPGESYQAVASAVARDGAGRTTAYTRMMLSYKADSYTAEQMEAWRLLATLNALVLGTDRGVFVFHGETADSCTVECEPVALTADELAVSSRRFNSTVYHNHASPQKSDKTHLEDMIESRRWTFAKTMAYAPHEYIVRDRDISRADFGRMVDTIRMYGQVRPWHSLRNWTLTVGDRYYWTMGYIKEDTVVINRAIADAGTPTYFADGIPFKNGAFFYEQGFVETPEQA